MGNDASYANNEDANRSKKKRREELEHLKKVRDLLVGLTPEHINAAELIALRETVKRLDEESKDTIPYTRTYFNVVCVMSLCLVFAGIVISSLEEDSDKKFDVLSCALALIAGWLAGAGAYKRSIMNATFIGSVAVLIVGFCLYLRSKGYLLEAICDSPGYVVGFGGLALTIFLPAKKKKDESKELASAEAKGRAKQNGGNRQWRVTGSFIVRALLAVALLIGIAWWSVYLRRHTQNFMCGMFDLDLKQHCISVRATEQQGSSSQQSPEQRVSGASGLEQKQGG